MDEPKRIQFHDDGETRLKLVRYARRHRRPRSQVYLLACKIGADILTAQSTIEHAREISNPEPREETET